MAYPFTPNERANALLARDGTALLIGLCLDQQVRTEKAFEAPYLLRERAGTIDAAAIAALRPAKLVSIFRTKPALHRFPASMAKRVRALCAMIVERYRGRGARVWSDAKTADSVFERLRSLPGFGEAKSASTVRILGKFGGVALAGWKRFGSDAALPWVYRNGKRI